MTTEIHTGRIVEDEIELTLADLSRACRVDAEWLLRLVDEGIIDPVKASRNVMYFSGNCLTRVRKVKHLQTDLGVNLAGAALVIDLLDEIHELRTQLSIFQLTKYNKESQDG